MRVPLGLAGYAGTGLDHHLALERIEPRDFSQGLHHRFTRLVGEVGRKAIVKRDRAVLELQQQTLVRRRKRPEPLGECCGAILQPFGEGNPAAVGTSTFNAMTTRDSNAGGQIALPRGQLASADHCQRAVETARCGNDLSTKVVRNDDRIRCCGQFHERSIEVGEKGEPRHGFAARRFLRIQKSVLSRVSSVERITLGIVPGHARGIPALPLAA